MNQKASLPKIYVMGPGVFRHDARTHFDYVRKIAAEFGFEPLIPWNPALHHPVVIYEQCMRMMREAAGGVVDLTPFRGTEPDSGSVFEAGFMHALGKPVAGYSCDLTTVMQRTQRFFAGKIGNAPGPWFSDGMTAENFGRSHNLMLGQTMPIRATMAEAFAILEARFDSDQALRSLLNKEPTQ